MPVHSVTQGAEIISDSLISPGQFTTMDFKTRLLFPQLAPSNFKWGKMLQLGAVQLCRGQKKDRQEQASHIQPQTAKQGLAGTLHSHLLLSLTPKTHVVNSRDMLNNPASIFYSLFLLLLHSRSQLTWGLFIFLLENKVSSRTPANR